MAAGRGLAYLGAASPLDADRVPATPDAEILGARALGLRTTDDNVRSRSHGAAREIRRFIEEGIAARRLKAGDRLPTERDMARTFGAGRNTVRRTLILLESEGRISRHVGRGTFVAADVPTGAGLHGAIADSPSIAQLARTAGPLDVMELRLALEPEIAALCVRRASRTEIERMRAIVKASETADSLQAFEDLDGDLHHVIAEATRNPLFAAIAALISTVRAEAEWGALKKRTLTDALRAGHTLEHVAIVEAIGRRDEAEARGAMETHLLAVRKMMFGS